MTRRLKPILAAGLAVAVAGCGTLAPSYERPPAPTAAQWPVDASAGSAGVTADIPWSQMFADQRLREIVRTALDNNRDLRVAVLNIERARAQYRIQRAILLPEVGVSATGTAQRTPGAVSATGEATVSHVYGVDLGISAYELDLFGRVRSLSDQALQTYLASEQTRRATHISLVAEVASAYLTLAADWESLRLAEATQRSREHAYALQRERYAAGSGDELTLRQAEGELEAANATLLSLQQQVVADRNALDLLVGAPVPDSMLPRDSGALQSALARHELQAGLPSDLLQRRPDILAAEHRLIAANANIGAARAAFFPSITLTAAAGRASDELSSLFDNGRRSWSFMPQIYLPIFTGGRLRAELEVSEAERDIAVAEYERSIQVAFREVADALAQKSVVDDQLAAQFKRAQAALAAHDLVQLRYENGIAGYLDVLDAQRTFYAAQQTLIETDLARQINVVTLYKTLGGGLDPSSASERPRPLPADETDTQASRAPAPAQTAAARGGPPP